MKSNWQNLQKKMEACGFLTSHNPAILALSAQPGSPLGATILQQYYYLVVTIVQFLTISMVRIQDQRAKKELRHNLGEELGSRTGGVSHQELLETLVRKELGLELRSDWSKATQTFITGLLQDFNTKPVRFMAGMVYALEATACPELLVVAEVINLAAGREAVKLSALTDRKSHSGEVSTLEDFLAIHTLDFEIGHESGLRTTLERLASENWEEFEAGFSHVLSAMEVWWEGLAKH